MASREGPALERLLRRMMETPADFLLPPRTTAGEGVIAVDALVADTLLAFGHSGARPKVEGSRELLSLRALCCWLLHDSEILAIDGLRARAQILLCGVGLNALSGAVKPADCVSDPERREELVRVALTALGLRPAGESESFAADRSRALDSVERNVLIRAAAAAEVRARAVREAAAKAAAEAASYYGRE